MLRTMSEAGDLQTPVAIVGGGPVGLVLGLFLDFYGVKCTIFNTEPEARMHPKGNGQNARTMEHYRQLGFSGEIRKLGLPDDHPFDQAYFTRLAKHEIFRFPMPNRMERIRMRREMPVIDQLPEPLYHVNQMYVEGYLLARARRARHIDVRFGWEVQWFTQDEDEVCVHAIKTDGTSEGTWRALYAVACDGGRSFVRNTLGIPYEGDVQKKDAYWAGQFFSVHMRIPDLYPRFVGHRRAWMYWAVNPDLDTRGVIIALNGVDEFMMLVKPKRGHTDVDRDEVARWVQKSIGEDIPVHVIGHCPWNAGQALVAERYRAGRIFLAGDAAHLFTPTGGFGMNTGIDDSHNLAWKLAALCQGWGGPRLVDSYEIERKPIGDRNTGASRKYASMMHDAVVPEDVEAEGPAGEAARKAASEISYVRKNHFVRPEHQDGVGVQLGARYDGSPIIVPDGEPPEDVFPRTYDEYFPSGVPGGRAPHAWLDDIREQGSSLFDRFGKGFTFLRFSAKCEAEPLERAAKATGVPLEVLDVPLPELRKLYERDLALIRPDQYICWRGDRLPDDVEGLLRVVTGQTLRREEKR
jgi:2-polyprenyl-6-methoxyphenol hydroxylase-like FAD-dependent oxidoreductase